MQSGDLFLFLSLVAQRVLARGDFDFGLRNNRLSPSHKEGEVFSPCAPCLCVRKIYTALIGATIGSVAEAHARRLDYDCCAVSARRGASHKCHFDRREKSSPTAREKISRRVAARNDMRGDSCSHQVTKRTKFFSVFSATLCETQTYFVRLRVRCVYEPHPPRNRGGAGGGVTRMSFRPQGEIFPHSAWEDFSQRRGLKWHAKKTWRTFVTVVFRTHPALKPKFLQRFRLAASFSLECVQKRLVVAAGADGQWHRDSPAQEQHLLFGLQP